MTAFVCFCFFVSALSAPHAARADEASRTLPVIEAAAEAELGRQLPAPEQDGLGSGLARTMFALVVVAVLVIGLAIVVRRFGGLGGGISGGGSPSGILEILGRYPIGRGATLVLLRVDQRVLLVSQTSGGKLGRGGMTTLCELSDPDEVAGLIRLAKHTGGESITARFRATLGRAEAQADEAERDVPRAPALADAVVEPRPVVGEGASRVEALRAKLRERAMSEASA